MKNILYIWQGEYPWDVRVEKICCALRDQGFHVIILARWEPGQSEQEYIDGLTIIRVGFERTDIFSTPVSYNPLWRRAIQDVIEKYQPVVVIPREILLAQAAADIAHRYHIPVIMDMAEHYPAAMRGWKKYYTHPIGRLLVEYLRIPDIMEKQSIRRVDGIITVCEENSERLHQQYGYPYEQMQVVSNTPELTWFEQVDKGIHLSDSITFAHHGFMTAERGLCTLVQGFALALLHYPNIRLFLAGEGESYTDVLRLVRTLDLQSSITLTGQYQYSDLVKMYSQMDIGVLPYHNDEFRNHTVPNKLFDYFACGKPVLVSHAIPMKRIVEETAGGIAIDCTSPEKIADGICSILSADTTQMSQNALLAAQQRYNWNFDKHHLLKFITQYMG